MNASELIKLGYRKVSNKNRTVSRIDRKDWVEVAYKHGLGHTDIGIAKAVETFYNGTSIEEFGFMRETVLYEAKSCADYYRRCLSKDTINNIPIEIFTKIPSSNWDETGFCEKEIVKLDKEKFE
jgi:hypothetical protein